MISLAQYVGPHAKSGDWTPQRQENAKAFLARCAALEAEMAEDGIVFPDNPTTGTGVSGQTFGGFRPQSCPQGAPGSSHKEGRGVDRYDPRGEIDQYLLVNQNLLEKHGIYIESPTFTQGWSHWTDRAPKSGRHVFIP